LSYFLIPRYGISGVGWAWLISQTLVAGIILFTNKETFHASHPV
jgi:O-antigen/teichoic acid export membrane protein